jgi:hypothetical protein
MISRWSDWKHYPRPGRGENIEAPISAGIYEVRLAGSGAVFGFEAVDNIAHALSQLPAARRSLGGWFGRRAPMPELEYRVFATPTKAAAKMALSRMVEQSHAYRKRAA